jgi:hypothetical protein
VDGRPFRHLTNRAIAVGRLKIYERRVLTMKTRKGLTRFGERLDDDEVRYFYSVVLRSLRG